MLLQFLKITLISKSIQTHKKLQNQQSPGYPHLSSMETSHKTISKSQRHVQAPLSMGFLQARMLEWVVTPSSRGSSQPRDRTQVSCIAGGFFISELPGKPNTDTLLLMKLQNLFSFHDFLSLHSLHVCACLYFYAM